MADTRTRINDPLDAFCTDTDAYLAGEPVGPLSGLTFAAKDIFDVAGHITGGGNPDWKATTPPAENTRFKAVIVVDGAAAGQAGGNLQHVLDGEGLGYQYLNFLDGGVDFHHLRGRWRHISGRRPPHRESW